MSSRSLKIVKPNNVILCNTLLEYQRRKYCFYQLSSSVKREAVNGRQMSKCPSQILQLSTQILFVPNSARSWIPERQLFNVLQEVAGLRRPRQHRLPANGVLRRRRGSTKERSDGRSGRIGRRRAELEAPLQEELGRRCSELLLHVSERFRVSRSRPVKPGRNDRVRFDFSPQNVGGLTARSVGEEFSDQVIKFSAKRRSDGRGIHLEFCLVFYNVWNTKWNKRLRS